MTVGIVGLGIMGSAYAGNLIAAGVPVAGCDPDAGARDRLTARGGVAHDAPGDWLTGCDLVIVSVASPAVLADVAAQLGRILRPGQIAMDTGTFALADKMAARDAVQAQGAILLDAPVSGTGAQAAKGDLVIMASGPADAIAQIRHLLDPLCHTVIAAGDFGAGSKLKYVANHAVALHNCAAAEVLHYADALGLDRDTVYRMLSKGAGQSRMLDLRMPLMMSGDYVPATAHMAMFEKDLSIIGADIAAQGITAPMFAAAAAMYDRAWSLIPKDHDTAAVFEVYRHADDST
ncbi:3-hydroxyisobutyrate dehydrogenase [Loktanella fryxellensis]|uniref:3-hydroxyisobutyrate dehydrogenase n=1 Tax=Loktanella fryxellensis TaxID=245187 RepID=A0A1H8C6R0_9RHOB|nr:NAD(P)-dependent oxidoreductase [Loktanella fryxellensis]SEM89958.1 3-hydroxyisobutyrate dehydrogenase [Loktanella fryxellensis]